MVSVDCRLRQELPMQTRGSSVTQRFRFPIAQQIEYFARVISPIACFAAGHRTVYAMTYTKWMLHIADFSGQWSGLLATWLGHCHGMKFFTFGMNAFGYSLCRQHPNNGRNISQHYLGIVGPKEYELGNQQGINALAGHNTVGILC